MSEEARKKNSISTVERNLKFWSDEENRRKASENMKIAWVKRDNITDEELDLRDNASIEYNENDFDEIIHNH